MASLWLETATGRYQDNVSYDVVVLRSNGDEIPVNLSILNLSDTPAPSLAAFIRDRTQHIERERSWAQLADTDSLTGILNRRAFLANAEVMAAAAERRGMPSGS